MTSAPNHPTRAPLATAPHLWAAASFALLCGSLPFAAQAQSNSDLSVTIAAKDTSSIDFDVIGQASCAEAIRTNVTLTGKIQNYPGTDDTEKYLYVTTHGESCTSNEVITACGGVQLPGAKCFCVHGVTNANKNDTLEFTRPLYLMLPLGESSCDTAAQTLYEFHLLMVNSNPSDKTPADAATATDATVDATTSSTTTSATEADSDPPLRMEIDLDPPSAPEGTFKVTSGDAAIVVSFPNIQSDEIDHYRVCWTPDPNFTASSDGSASGDATATASAQCSEFDGTEDANLSEVTVKTRYYVWVAAVDNASNVGAYRMVGSGIPVDYLDFAEYYRALHGHETGGCSTQPGVLVPGAGVGALLLGGLASLRRRSRRIR